MCLANSSYMLTNLTATWNYLVGEKITKMAAEWSGKFWWSVLFLFLSSFWLCQWITSSHGSLFSESVSGSLVHWFSVCFNWLGSERGSQLIAYVLDLKLQLLNPAVSLMELLPKRSDLFLLLIKHIQQLKHTANVQTLTLSSLRSVLRSNSNQSW